MTAHISTKRDVLATFCRRRHISRLAVFGAATRGDFRPDSDVGVLVEFEDGHVPGLDFMTIERELSKLLNHQVDLITRKFVIPTLRDHVLTSIQVLYTAPPELNNVRAVSQRGRVSRSREARCGSGPLRLSRRLEDDIDRVED